MGVAGPQSAQVSVGSKSSSLPAAAPMLPLSLMERCLVLPPRRRPDVDALSLMEQCLLLPCVREAVVDCCWTWRSHAYGPVALVGRDNGTASACVNRAWNITWRARKRKGLLQLWRVLLNLCEDVHLNDPRDKYAKIVAADLTDNLIFMQDMLW